MRPRDTSGHRPDTTLLASLGILLGLAFLLMSAPGTHPGDLRTIDVTAMWGTARLDSFGVHAGLPAWALAIVAVACALAPLALHRELRDALLRALREGRAGTALIPCALLLLFTLVPTAETAEGLLGIALGSAGVILLGASMAALFPRAGARATELATGIARRCAAMPRTAFLVTTCGVFFVLAALGSSLLFGRIPHVVDDMDQLFHARMFLEGHVRAPVPVPLDAFDMTHMISTHGWYSQYPPGHTLLLALGLLVHAPWLVNVIAGTLTVLVLYLFAREVYDEGTARIAAALATVSPFLLLMSSSFMNHATAALFFLAFCLFFARMERRGGVIHALCAGGALGYALIIRPMDAAAAAAPMAVYAGLRLRAAPARASRARRSGPAWPALCVIAIAAFSIPLAGLLLFQKATNGDPWKSGFEALNGVNALPGFGHSGWWGTPHTPARGLEWTWKNFGGLHRYLFGWPLPSLLVAILGFGWLRRRTAWDWMLAASAMTLALAYATYWFHDLTLGPRFMYTAAAPLVILSARGLHALAGALHSARISAHLRREVTAAAILVLAVSSLYAIGVTAPAFARYYARDYFDANASAGRAAVSAHLGNAVLFVPPFLYPSVFPMNTPGLDGRVVFARDRWDARNQEVIARYPGRAFFKLHALDRYTVIPYGDARVPGDGLYALPPGGALTIEALATQMGLFRDCVPRERKTGEFGSGWMHNDYLEVLPHRIGAEAGFAISAATVETRSATLALTRGPAYGDIAVLVNGTPVRQVDLYAPAVDTVLVHLPDLPFTPGMNVISMRVDGKNASSESYGLGIDYVAIAPAGGK